MHKKINIIQPDTDALVVIDVVNDLFPNGAYPVPDGDKIIEPILRIYPLFKKIAIFFLAIVPNHPILKEKRYCVEGSWGAEYPYKIISQASGDAVFLALISRGRNPHYGINDPFTLPDNTLWNKFRESGVTRIFLAGLPLETTIKEAALGFKNQNFEVVILEDCVKPRNTDAGKAARQDLEIAGIQFMRTSQFFD